MWVFLGMGRDCEGENILGFQTSPLWGWMVAKGETSAVSAVKRKMLLLAEAQGVLPWRRMKMWMISDSAVPVLPFLTMVRVALQDMGRTEGRACCSKGGSAEGSPSPSCRSRTRIRRQCFLLVDLESQFVYTVLLTVESFYFQPANYVFIFVVTVWQFFVQLVLRSPLPLEPVGYSCWCNCSCNFCAGLRNTVHYLLRNHCC